MTSTANDASRPGQPFPNRRLRSGESGLQQLPQTQPRARAPLPSRPVCARRSNASASRPALSFMDRVRSFGRCREPSRTMVPFGSPDLQAKKDTARHCESREMPAISARLPSLCSAFLPAGGTRPRRTNVTVSSRSFQALAFCKACTAWVMLNATLWPAAP